MPARARVGVEFVSALALVLSLAACASAPEPKVTAEDVRAAADSGQLPNLYETILVELQAPGISDGEKAELQLRLEDAGRRLGAGVEAEVEASMEASRLPSGQVPLQAFGALEPRMAKLERWSPATYARVSEDLSKEKAATEEVIAAKEAALGQLSKEEVTEKLGVLDDLGALNGAGSAAQASYAGQRNKIVAELRKDASTAIENEEYIEAQRMLALVATIEPADRSIEGELVEIDAKLFEQRFYEALENDRPDDAYQALVTLSEAKNFDKIRPRLQDSSDVMADYFVALAAGATESGNVVNAFRWFGQARDIRTRLGLEVPQNVPESQHFVDEIHRRYRIAAKKELYGLAWGYLQVIDEVSQVGPTLRREIRESHEEVLAKAVKRLSVAPFTDSHDSQASYGDTLTAKLLQYLFEKSGDDVRIIEREKLEAIKAEKTLAGGDSDSLIAVDYLVEGNILEAKVDSSERAGKKMVRVVVEKETVPNPEWQRWSAATEGERKKQGLVRPTTTTMIREKKEDIEIGISNHRKVGVFSVSYRMIDADTAKVLFADTQRVKNEVEDTSSDGVQLGEFKQEFKVAHLPTDIEVLDQLAEDVSAALGKRLAEVLASPELRYEERGDRFVREGNFIDASEQFAYATVLGERKNIDTDELRKKLQRAVVSAAIDAN
jgi:curli biogenesis system outer membrane secretion channel CsgG